MTDRLSYDINHPRLVGGAASRGHRGVEELTIPPAFKTTLGREWGHEHYHQHPFLCAFLFACSLSQNRNNQILFIQKPGCIPERPRDTQKHRGPHSSFKIVTQIGKVVVSALTYITCYTVKRYRARVIEMQLAIQKEILNHFYNFSFSEI